RSRRRGDPRQRRPARPRRRAGPRCRRGEAAPGAVAGAGPDARVDRARLPGDRQRAGRDRRRRPRARRDRRPASGESGGRGVSAVAATFDTVRARSRALALTDARALALLGGLCALLVVLTWG